MNAIRNYCQIQICNRIAVICCIILIFFLRTLSINRRGRAGGGVWSCFLSDITQPLRWSVNQILFNKLFFSLSIIDEMLEWLNTKTYSYKFDNTSAVFTLFPAEKNRNRTINKCKSCFIFTHMAFCSLLGGVGFDSVNSGERLVHPSRAKGPTRRPPSQIFRPPSEVRTRLMSLQHGCYQCAHCVCLWLCFFLQLYNGPLFITTLLCVFLPQTSCLHILLSKERVTSWLVSNFSCFFSWIGFYRKTVVSLDRMGPTGWKLAD